MELKGLLSSVASWWRILVPSTASIILWYGSYRYILDKRYRLPPGPTPLPFIGNVATMIKLGPQYGECMYKIMRHVAQSYGNVFTFYLGQIRVVVLNDSNAIRETLVDQGQIFSRRIDNKLPGFETLGDGISMANDEIWKRNRRLMLTTMHNFGMGRDLMVSKVQDEASVLVQQFEKSARSGEPFFPRRIVANAISNVICSLVFGKRFENPEDPVLTDILRRLDEFLLVSVETPLTMVLPFLSYFYIPRVVQYFCDLTNHVTRMIGDAVKDHRTDFSAENIRDFADVFINAELQPESAMSLEEYGSMMTDMFLGGTETTTTALLWTLLYLAKHQDVQRKCHEEIDSVIRTDRMPEAADRPKLVYLDAVIHEVLRCAPVLPIALYHSNLEQPSTIRGYDIPPMTLILYNVATLHLDATYWKDPETFKPERWVDENGKLTNHSSHFMPFGIGPRKCLGESLARSEHFIFLTAILQRFKFDLKTPDVDFFPNNPGVINSCPEFKIVANYR